MGIKVPTNLRNKAAKLIGKTQYPRRQTAWKKLTLPPRSRQLILMSIAPPNITMNNVEKRLLLDYFLENPRVLVM
jgi:hypothetical protein